MSSTEKAGAMKRFPDADLEIPYNRTQVLRSSEGSDTSERSKAAYTISPSPPAVSPRTIVPDRKIRNSEWRKHAPESYNEPPTPLRGPITPSFEPSYFPPVAMHEESSTFWTTTSAASMVSNGANSSKSSNNKQASKSPKISKGSTPEPFKHQNNNPSEPFSNQKWENEASRHWFGVRPSKKSRASASDEIEHDKASIVRRSTGGDMMRNIEGSNDCEIRLPSPTTPRSFSSTPRSLRSMSLSTTHEETERALNEPKEGLYCRTKRALGLKHDPIGRSQDEQDLLERSVTSGMGEALHRVSSQLREFKLRTRESNLSDTGSNLSIAAPSAITRWHNIQSLYSSSTRSSSSSLRSLARGRNRPATTPDPQRMYTGSDMNKYLTVELTNPAAPTFLPSEARRIDTPGKRDFREYFESTAQSTAQTPLSMSSTSTMPDSVRVECGSVRSSAPLLLHSEEVPPNFPGSPSKSSNAEWLEANFNDVSAAEAQTREDFVLSVPEHLPSSPMCPRHPKNKSKGKGVCVYHGRNVP